MPRPRRIRRANPAVLSAKNFSNMGHHIVNFSFPVVVTGLRGNRVVTVNMVGFRHADAGFPTLPTVKRNVRRLLSQNKSPIYSEFQSNFINHDFTGRVREIEANALQSYLIRAITRKVPFSKLFSYIASRIGLPLRYNHFEKD